MFCIKCGFALTNDAVFCPKCGVAVSQAETDEVYTDSVEIIVPPKTADSIPLPERSYYTEPQRKSGSTKVILTALGGVAVLVIGVILITSVLGGFGNFFSGIFDDQYVKMVKTGTLSGYPNKTVGKAFDDFLSNAKWESGVGEGGIRFVNVRGKAMLMGEKVDVVVQFTVDSDNKTFEYRACEINGVPQSNLMALGLFEAVYMNYL